MRREKRWHWGIGGHRAALLIVVSLLVAGFAAPPDGDTAAATEFTRLANGSTVTPATTATTAKPPARPNVQMRAYVVADFDSGAILAAYRQHRRYPPASTLKTLTALTALPRLDPDSLYRVRPEDLQIGSAVGLVPGELYEVDDLFHGLFLPSGNDAAHAIASAVGNSNGRGGIAAFVKLMNAEAKRIGANRTKAVNPSGLDAVGQLTTAHDLALIARAGMRHPEFRRYVATRTYQFPIPGAKKTYQIQNTNRLLGQYEGAIGIKNGYTTNAQNTLVGLAERNNRRILIVGLGIGPPTYDQAAVLLDWGFAAVDKVRPIGRIELPEEAAWARPYGDPPRLDRAVTALIPPLLPASTSK